MSRTGPKSGASDQELVARSAHGDHGAFEELYFRYRDWVTNLAWRLTHDRELTLDILQETFAYLVRRLPSLKLEGRLTTLLYPAVKHLAIDLQRRARLPIEHAHACAPEETSGSAPEQHQELRDAVDGLPEGQREVLLMRFVSDMSLAEIATALAIPVGTVKSRLHLALGALELQMAGGQPK